MSAVYAGLFKWSVDAISWAYSINSIQSQIIGLLQELHMECEYNISIRMPFRSNRTLDRRKWREFNIPRAHTVYNHFLFHVHHRCHSTCTSRHFYAGIRSGSCSWTTFW